MHTLAAGALLDRRQIHRFDEIGYRHDDWEHCPADAALRAAGDCACDPAADVSTGSSGARCASSSRAWGGGGGDPQVAVVGFFTAFGTSGSAGTRRCPSLA